ncbi:MAG TPA: HK97 family phage prohead protease [Terricaulis sp.]|nr:HK97 family phage prohead protease [Terricaulis sp.]
MKLETLQLDAPELKFTAEGDQAGEIEAYASIFGELDQGGDIVVKGAFKKSLIERRKQDRWDIPMFFGHAHASVPIGVWTDFREDSKGLKCKGRLIFEVPEAKQVRAVILAGGGMGVSIGYKTIKRSYVTPDGVRTDDWRNGAARHLEEVDLHECSLTAMPMCRGAQVTSAKFNSEDGAIHALKSVDQYLSNSAAMRFLARALNR